MNLTASATRCSPLGLSYDKEIAPEETIVHGAQALTVPGCRPGARIRVLVGILWITQEGDAEDYLIGVGDDFICTRPGRVVVESLVPCSRFVVVPAGA